MRYVVYLIVFFLIIIGFFVAYTVYLPDLITTESSIAFEEKSVLKNSALEYIETKPRIGGKGVLTWEEYFAQKQIPENEKFYYEWFVNTEPKYSSIDGEYTVTWIGVPSCERKIDTVVGDSDFNWYDSLGNTCETIWTIEVALNGSYEPTRFSVLYIENT